MDVVQEQHALALGFEPAHGAGDDLRWRDVAVPVVGDDVGREHHQRTRGKLAFDDLGAPKTRDTEERRQPAAIAKRRAHIVDARIDLPAHLLVRYAVEAERMILAVRADRVSLVANA